MSTQKRKVRILSLDGGGIRGIVPATVLTYVEDELIRKTSNPNARIADYFDMIVGTSTGGILACFYLIPSAESNSPVSKYNAQKALELYTKHGHEIFDDSKRNSWFGIRQLFNATRYSATNIERIFKDVFGDLKLNELLQQCIIPAYDMYSGKAIFFNSRETKAKAVNRSFYVKDVVRSTSAAPTYFPPAKIKNLFTGEKMINLDGGVFANNPSVCAYTEARKTNFKEIGVNRPKAKDMLILSLGTGSMPIDLKNKQNSRKWGIINWAKAVPDIMMDGGLDTVNHQMKMIFNSLDEQNQRNYKRVDVPEKLRIPKDDKLFKLAYNADMADASPKNIKDLTDAGQKTIEEANKKRGNEYTLDEFIDLLILESRI